MFKRIMVAVVGIPLLLVVFFLLEPIWLAVLISLLSVLAMYEVMWNTGFLKHKRILAYSMLAAALVPLWSYFGGQNELLLLGAFCYVFLLVCEALASKYQVSAEQMGGAFFFTFFIPYFLSAFLRIRTGALGTYYILIPIVAAFLSDAFALFAGMLFGKHKLAPSLSPKKTVEGAVGGFVGAIVSCVVYGLVMQFGFDLQVNYLAMAVYGALGSVVSQIGDLTFSYIKRQYDLKDYGKIFPGHGGVLDRFDSVIFCAPLIEILIWVLPALG